MRARRFSDGRRSAGAAVLRLVMSPPPPEHQVELQVAADAVWLSAVRLLVGDLAARADFDVDAVADLRLAVDEGCAELLRSARPGSVLTCRFAVYDDRITMTASVPVEGVRTFDTTGFGWRVLSTLADDVEVLTGDTSSGGSPALALRLGVLRRGRNST